MPNLLHQNASRLDFESEDYHMHKKSLIFHVAVNGQDDWSGRLETPVYDNTDGPLASIGEARNRIRELRKAGRLDSAIEVVVHAGLYEIKETLWFGPEDVGDMNTPVTYRVAGDGEVILAGGKKLTGFEHKGNGVYMLDLSGEGDTAFGFDQLFFNGVRQQMARYPDFDPDNPYDGGWLFVEGEIPEDVMGLYEGGKGSNNSFICRDPRLKKWLNICEVEVFVFPRFNWVNDIIKIRNYNPDTGVVTLEKPAQYEIYAGDRYYFRNVREELDTPGEWYLDMNRKIVYFYPPSNPDEAIVTAPLVKNIIIVDGSPNVEPDYESFISNTGSERHLMQDPDSINRGYISFEGFTIEACDGTGIIFRNVRGCEVHDCTVRNAGGDGVKIMGGAECRISGNEVLETGSHGISITGGMRYLHECRYKSCGHEAANNYIHHTGAFIKCSAGVAITGVGITAANNLIHDGPRWGITSSGNDNIIEYNHIHHVNLETSDTGAIYLCNRDFTMRGTKIRYNRIHDITGYHLLGGKVLLPVVTFGIYLDDWSSDTEVCGNLIYRTPMGGVYLHGGQDNVVENNMLLEAEQFMANFKRWDPQKEYTQLGTYGQGLKKNTFRCNVMASRSANVKPYCFVKVNGEDGEYDLASNLWEKNLIWCYGNDVFVADEIFGDKITWDEWLKKGYETGSIIANPCIRGLDTEDFRLEDDSPAYRLGFKPLPLDRMGLQKKA